MVELSAIGSRASREIISMGRGKAGKNSPKDVRKKTKATVLKQTKGQTKGKNTVSNLNVISNSTAKKTASREAKEIEEDAQVGLGRGKRPRLENGIYAENVCSNTTKIRKINNDFF